MAKREKNNIVLYITDIWLILPSDAKRKGRSTPLEWGKFRSPADGSETGQQYQLRRQAIKAVPKGFAVLGVYDEILIHYGFDRTAALRGWLVNHKYEAATTAQIAQAIGTSDLHFLKRAIRMLVETGLLKRVERPDIEAAVRDDKTIRFGPFPPAPAPDDADDPDKGEGEGKSEQATNETPQSEDLAGRGPDGGRLASGQPPDGVRPRAGPPPDADGPTLDRETPDKETPTASATPSPSADGNGADSTDKETASAPPRPPDRPPDDVRPPEKPQDDGKTSDIPQGDGKPQDADTGPPEATDATASPTTTPPVAEAVEPTEADHQGKEKTGEVFDHTTAGIDSVDVLVRDVGKALYPTREDLAVEGRKARPPQQADEFEARERGALTVAWSAVMNLDLKPTELFELRTRAVKEADRIRRKKTKKPKGAPWRYWFNKHMESLIGAARWSAAQRVARCNASGPP